MKFVVSGKSTRTSDRRSCRFFAEMELADYKAASGPNINVLGRWHDVMNMTGFALCEANGTGDMARWLTQWHTVCDFEIVPVMDDEEAHALAREMYPAQ